MSTTHDGARSAPRPPIRRGLIFGLAPCLASATMACGSSDLSAPASAAAQKASHDDSVEWDGLVHDTRDRSLRSAPGAVPIGQAVTLRLRTRRGDVTGAAVRVRRPAAGRDDLYPMSLAGAAGDAAADTWQVTLPAQPAAAVLRYHFRVTDGADTDYYGDDAARDGGRGQASDEEA